MSHKTTILIADDHAIIRSGLTALLETEPDLRVVGTAADGDEAVRETLRLMPDVLLLDLMMPIRNGIETAADIRRTDCQTKILILTTYGTSDGISKALAAGADGACLKSSDESELISAIRQVAAGGTAITPDVERLIANDPPIEELTARQFEVLDYVTRGLTNTDIARVLDIQETSVREHVTSILKKLGAANRSEAVAIALRKHLLKI